MFKTHELRTVSLTDPSDLVKLILARQPVKVSGLINNWKSRNWDFDYFRTILKDRVVKVLTNLPQKCGGVLSGGQNKYETEMTFSDFVDMAQDENALPSYLGYVPIGDIVREHDHYDFKAITPNSNFPTDTRIWIGSANTCSGLHSDLKDNIFTQIHGSKKVYLVPFSQTHLVYPFIDNIINSRVDPENFDERAFPKFKMASIYVTTVNPGEIIYIPRGCWHYLRADNPSISINHWFGPPISAKSYLYFIAKLGYGHIARMFVDAFRYSILGRKYNKDFFFTPNSNGQRFYNLLRHGNFSHENDPIKHHSKHNKK